MCLTSLLLTGCTHFNQQTDAGARFGAAAAMPVPDPLPEECKGPVKKLPLRLGDGAWSTVQRYEGYVEGPVSDLLANCWQLHENQRIGIAAPSTSEASHP